MLCIEKEMYVHVCLLYISRKKKKKKKHNLALDAIGTIKRA